MSVQLVLFPQVGLSNEFIVDGLDFNSIDVVTNYDTYGTGNIFQIIANNSPGVVNQWRRFRALANDPSPVSLALAAGSGGTLRLASIVSAGIGCICGVYQQLSGLITGNSYTLTINLTPGVGTLMIGRYNGTAGSSIQPSANTSQIVFSFTALSPNDVIYIGYLNNTSATLVISDISIISPSTETYEGQVICDLYEDEEIPLTLSIDNFKNVAEKIQSYSKDFNLPATKRNNKVFSNIFEITRTVSNPYEFNPYVRTRAILKQNGVILFDGALRLIDIQEREGEISYNVNLYAQTIALADNLKNKTFDDIDFSELQHTYNKVNIKETWDDTTGLPLTNPLLAGSYAGTAGTSRTQVLKYPFVDWTGQILIANNATGNAATAGNPELTSLEDAFRPWIQVKYLLDRIFSEAQYTYTSSIFESTDFGKLFMDFNWGGDSMPGVIDDTSYTGTYKYGSGAAVFDNTTTSFEILPLIDNTITGGQSNSSVPPDYNTSGGDIYKIVGTTSNQLYSIDYSWILDHVGGTTSTMDAQWQFYDASTGQTETIDIFSEYSFVGVTHTFAGNFTRALDTGDKLWAEYRLSNSGTYTSAKVSLTQTSLATFNVSSTIVYSSTLNALRGEINQWDFLKGLLTMFNLVTLQDNTDPANILIEPYSDVFITTTKGTSLEDRSIQNDWTDKVDLKDIALTPLNELKKTTIFKYEEDEEDYVADLYKKSTRGHLYGSKVFSAENLTLLDGEDEIVASPFAATVSKPLFGGFTDFIIPSIYSLNSDGTTSGFDNKPRILYNTSGDDATAMAVSYYIPEQNGISSENNFDLYTFSHLTDIPTTTTSDDYNFGECQYFQGLGQTVSSNLFNNYWLPYYNQLYSPDTKVMTLKVNLQAGDIARFKFSDYVMIKNRAYRVNRIDYKPKDLSTVEFILIN